MANVSKAVTAACCITARPHLLANPPPTSMMSPEDCESLSRFALLGATSIPLRSPSTTTDSIDRLISYVKHSKVLLAAATASLPQPTSDLHCNHQGSLPGRPRLIPRDAIFKYPHALESWWPISQGLLRGTATRHGHFEANAAHHDIVFNDCGQLFPRHTP